MPLTSRTKSSATTSREPTPSWTALTARSRAVRSSCMWPVTSRIPSTCTFSRLRDGALSMDARRRRIRPTGRIPITTSSSTTPQRTAPTGLSTNFPPAESAIGWSSTHGAVREVCGPLLFATSAGSSMRSRRCGGLRNSIGTRSCTTSPTTIAPTMAWSTWSPHTLSTAAASPMEACWSALWKIPRTNSFTSGM